MKHFAILGVQKCVLWCLQALTTTWLPSWPGCPREWTGLRTGERGNVPVSFEMPLEGAHAKHPIVYTVQSFPQVLSNFASLLSSAKITDLRASDKSYLQFTRLKVCVGCYRLCLQIGPTLGSVLHGPLIRRTCSPQG